jgi:hypothetical protein
MQPPKIASREDWLAARKWLLGGELLLGAFNWLDLTPRAATRPAP